MMKILKEFFDYTVKIVIFALLPIVVFTLLTSKTEILGMQSFVVLSGSMTPTLPVGSIVYSLESKTYEVKDVISYKTKSGQVVTHRITEIVRKPEGVFYRIKGDANKTVDSELILQKDVLGKAVTLIPFLGYLVYFTRTLPGFLLLIITPALILIGFEVWQIKREIEREIEKKIMARMQVQ